MLLEQGGAVFRGVRWAGGKMHEKKRVLETHPYVPASLKLETGSPRPTAVIPARPSTL